MTEEGLSHRQRRQEGKFSAATCARGDETLQVGHAVWKDIREQLAESINGVDPYLGWELRAGEWVVLNSQLGMGRIDENIHGYVRTAAFWHGVALELAPQTRVKIERKFVAGDIRQRLGGDRGQCGDFRLGGCVRRAAARDDNESCDHDNHRKEFFHVISPRITCYQYEAITIYFQCLTASLPAPLQRIVSWNFILQCRT